MSGVNGLPTSSSSSLGKKAQLADLLPNRELDWCEVGHVGIYVLVSPKGELIINVFSWPILLLEKQLNIHAIDAL